MKAVESETLMRVGRQIKLVCLDCSAVMFDVEGSQTDIYEFARKNRWHVQDSINCLCPTCTHKQILNARTKFDNEAPF